MTTIDIYPSSLPGEPLEHHTATGGTLGDWLTSMAASYTPGPAQPLAATVDGVVVPPEQWSSLVLADQHIELRPMPGEPMTIMIAVGSILGGIVISQLMTPKIPGSNGKQGQSIASASGKANTPKLYQVIPEIAGRVRVFPDLLSAPRRYFVDQRTEALDLLLCVGVGEYEISPGDVRIGATPITALGDEVSYTHFAPGASVGAIRPCWYNCPEVGATRGSAGLRLSDPTPEKPTGTASIVTGTAAPVLAWSAAPDTLTVNNFAVRLDADYASAAALLAAINAGLDPDYIVASLNGAGRLVLTEQYPYSGQAIAVGGPVAGIFGSPGSVTGTETTGRWAGPFRVTPSHESASRFEVDFLAQRGLGTLGDSGGVSQRKVRIELQWRSAGGAWNPVTYELVGATVDQLGWTREILLPGTFADVDMRARRVGAESTDTKALDRIEWYGARCVMPTPASYAGVTTLALTIRGSDRIGGSTENQISAVVARKLGGVVTRHIAPWLRYVCASVGYGAHDIDGAALDELDAVWRQRGDTYDFATTSQRTVKQALASALRPGFSELTTDRGMIRPARDAARQVFEHLYTPQNMVSGLKRFFSAPDPDDFDGVDVEYQDSTTWETETVSCRLPGDAGLRVEKLQIEGVTDRARAWRLGMRQRRAHAFRRKTFAFETEWDALNSRYLSYVALADDVPGYGQSALLRAVTPVGAALLLRCSEPLRWETGAQHVLGLRRPDGTLAGPWPASPVDGDAFGARITAVLDFAPVFVDAIETTHVIFGVSTRWSYPALVTEISPSGDTVSVSAVIYDDRIYADDDNAPA